MARLKAPRKRWTAEEDAIVLARYPHEETGTLAVELGTLPTRLHRRAQVLGVRKTAAYLQQIAQQAVVKNGERSRFQKGMTPPNKGKRLRDYITDYETLKRIARSQFKVGNRPHTHQPVGSYAQDPDGYWKLKVTDLGSRKHGGKNRSHWDWRYVHRLTYEAAYGPIPPGSIVILLDGDMNACLEPDNLIAVTRAELARMNQAGFSQLPKERQLRRAAVLEAKLRQATHEAGKAVGLSMQERCAMIGTTGDFKRRKQALSGHANDHR